MAVKVFLCSLFIQTSFNYRGMQNLGFAFSLLPLARRQGGDKERLAALLIRHLQLFNTHPYLSAPIIGSVVRMEKDHMEADRTGVAAVNLKNALMGPYAALGDSFFWGAMKPLAAVFSVMLALHEYLLAPLAWLLLYNPVHLWVRVGGFVEGYRRGKEGIDFIRYLELPWLTGRIRWISLAGLGAIAAMISHSLLSPSLGRPVEFLAPVAFLSLIILCYWGIRNGISQVKIIYGMFIIGCVLSF
ncbi:MAG: PTS system mannose/fructose/sorbose family transporter subunit IID [Deltaproteobacteria bacterium]|nr:PTS system mannose/fructose/sorbose family transporter subunit IID [Deltaproteobacteria bacterium]